MSKIIESPVPRWPGTVTIADPLNYTQYFAFLDAYDAAQEMAKDETMKVAQYYQAMLPGVCACIESCELKGLPQRLTVTTFPATPPRSAARLIAWLLTEVGALYREAEEVPNA